MAELVRVGLAAGAKISKEYEDKYAGAVLAFGPAVRIHVFARRELVCERVVTGVTKVTETVPDPMLLAEVPLVEVITEVEQVEWVCRPLLAAESATAVA